MPTVGVISPIKDEAENLPALVESVEDQSLRPTRWVIVDDGSTDGSTEIIAAAASDHDWVRRAETEGADEYDIGVHYARVLSTGFAVLREEFGDELDYYVVLDGDMRLSPRYLEALASYLDEREDLAIASASVFTRTDHGLDFVEQDERHPLGGATMYDGDFYRDIGGPPTTPCVDSVTKAKANIRGYRARYATELDVRAVQSRPAHENGDPIANARTLGENNYAIGYPPVAAVMRAGHVGLDSSPVRGLSYLRGYFSAWLAGDRRLADDEVVRYYRRQKPRQMVRSIRNEVVESVVG